MVIAFIVGFVLGLISAVILSGALDMYIEHVKERERRKNGGDLP